MQVSESWSLLSLKNNSVKANIYERNEFWSSCSSGPA